MNSQLSHCEEGVLPDEAISNCDEIASHTVLAVGARDERSEWQKAGNHETA